MSIERIKYIGLLVYNITKKTIIIRLFHWSTALKGLLFSACGKHVENKWLTLKKGLKSWLMRLSYEWYKFLFKTHLNFLKGHKNISWLIFQSSHLEHLSPGKGFPIEYSFSKSIWGAYFQEDMAINNLKFSSCENKIKKLKNGFKLLISQFFILQVSNEYFLVFDLFNSWDQKSPVVEKYLIIQRIVMKYKHFQPKSKEWFHRLMSWWEKGLEPPLIEM